MGALHLTLRRMNWRFINPFLLGDDRGNEVPLTHMKPAMVKDLLLDGARRCMERKVGEKWGERDPSFRGRRACVDLALRELGRKRNGLTKLELGAYRSATCGALMTFSRAASQGYHFQNRCPLCGVSSKSRRHCLTRGLGSAFAVFSISCSWLVFRFVLTA